MTLCAQHSVESASQEEGHLPPSHGPWTSEANGTQGLCPWESQSGNHSLNTTHRRGLGMATRWSPAPLSPLLRPLSSPYCTPLPHSLASTRAGGPGPVSLMLFQREVGPRPSHRPAHFLLGSAGRAQSLPSSSELGVSTLARSPLSPCARRTLPPLNSSSEGQALTRGLGFRSTRPPLLQSSGIKVVLGGWRQRLETSTLGRGKEEGPAWALPQLLLST